MRVRRFGIGVATQGDSVPKARYAYLGGTGTLRSLELLEQGGSALLYVENRYTIPLAILTVPLGEKGITHWHGTSEGFGGRKPIDERIAKAKKTN